MDRRVEAVERGVSGQERDHLHDLIRPARAALAALLLLVAAGGAGPIPASGPGEPVPGWSPREGVERIGTPAPEWRQIDWLQGGPLSLAGVRGRVVLLRFWLTGCPLCARTAPALRELWEAYRERGLLVVGLHHPKSEEAREADRVAAAARDLGFGFPIGLDNGWATIRAYGVGTDLRRFTSVSFLIDRGGTIRFVHDGGEFHAGGGPGHEECNAAYEALRRTIERVLAEPWPEAIDPDPGRAGPPR